MIEISTENSKLDVELIHSFLTKTYWAKGRSLEEVKTSIDNSLNFGVYLEDKQIGFARVCTDYTVFTYLMDVFVLPEFRGQGISKLLMEFIINEPKLEQCRTWLLKTKDAHSLYQQFGYSGLKNPDLVMEKLLK